MDCGGCSNGQACGGAGTPNVCGAALDSGLCTPTQCQQANGQYCGIVGNGCGGKMDCGSCPAGQACGIDGIANVCATIGCSPASCLQPGGGRYCGVVGDGCGGKIDCGSCPAGQSCGGAGVSGVCGAAVDSGTCTPTICNQLNGKYCGIVGNGCGGQMDCGGCSGGQSCGGSGIPNLCSFAPDSGVCRPLNCTQMNGKYCGVVGNGCGGQMDCGGCGAGLTCGGAGLPNVCGAAADSGTCMPTSCTQAGGKYCGVVGNGCGGTQDCGGCPGGQTCGGAGTPNLCGSAADSGACSPTVCTNANGKYCGVVGNGCGGSIDCGSCPGAQTCGGAGFSNLCGFSPDSGACTRLSCTTNNGKYCGVVGDGCGGQIDCGGCRSGADLRCAHRSICNAPCPLCGSIQQCDGGTTASIKGVAYTGIPLNPDPIYNAVVYIPNVAKGTVFPPLSDTLACGQCKALTADEAIASAITGPDGSFELKNVPSGTNIPIILQLGQWRRQTTITVNPCAVNNLPAGTIRLPRNQGEGDIPLTALSSGGADTLECILRKMGVDDNEFTIPTGGGRVSWYRATGAKAKTGTTPDRPRSGPTSTTSRSTTWCCSRERARHHEPRQDSRLHQPPHLHRGGRPGLHHSLQLHMGSREHDEVLADRQLDQRDHLRSGLADGRQRQPDVPEGHRLRDLAAPGRREPHHRHRQLEPRRPRDRQHLRARCRNTASASVAHVTGDVATLPRPRHHLPANPASLHVQHADWRSRQSAVAWSTARST